MRTFKSICLLWLSFFLFSGCTESDLFTSDMDGKLKGCSNDDIKTVTVPFKVDFIGEYTSVVTPGSEEGCEDIFQCHVHVDFRGEGTHLGKFTGYFKFCACGPEGLYGPTESLMVAANGDTLFVSCQGRVVAGRQEDHPEHVKNYWRDPFVILGGTGRFEGATGSGYTDDYNSTLDPNSHHHWRGSITLIKGRGKS